MLLKNNKGKLVEVKTLKLWYGTRNWYEKIENSINAIEMYDNGYIKRIEWKTKEKFKNAVFSTITNERKGILCYDLSLDLIGKDNLCKIDYEENNKYYTLFLDLRTDKNFKLLSDKNGYSKIFITDNNYYNELIQDYSILKERQIILPYSHIKSIKEEIINKIPCSSGFVIEKKIAYMTDENEIYTELIYEFNPIY